jgi:hypothetical protein
MYKMIEEPVLPIFGYYLPDEFGKKLFGAQYVTSTKKWYIPSDGVPAFELSVYAGRLQADQPQAGQRTLEIGIFAH